MDLSSYHSIVCVRAQVMMRDDSTGGWVPMGGGGLSNVSVRKRKIQHEDDQPCKHEYLVYGKRHSDHTVFLNCTIKKDFEYNKVMPTFHHWKTGNKKYGLTFQTAAEARAFDKGVRLAIEDLLDANSLACPHKHYSINQKGMSVSSPMNQFNLDVGDEDVFMQLHLPLEKAGKCSEENGVRSPTPPPRVLPIEDKETALFLPPPYPKNERQDSISRLKRANLVGPSKITEEKKSPSSSTSSPFGLSSSSSSCSGLSNGKKKKLISESSRNICAYCRESFDIERNVRGSCPEAPDLVRKTIETTTCLHCAKCLLYHCMSDSEGNYIHPCDCSNIDGHRWRRWISLSLLSILVPCLCCYPIFIGCYKCSKKCNLCGGKHLIL